MADIAQVVEAFNAEEGIEAERTTTFDGRALVKVMDESAVGRFYKVARETGADISQVTRNDLEDTVLDAWADE